MTRRKWFEEIKKVRKKERKNENQNQQLLKLQKRIEENQNKQLFQERMEERQREFQSLTLKLFAGKTENEVFFPQNTIWSANSFTISTKKPRLFRILRDTRIFLIQIVKIGLTRKKAGSFWVN